MNDLPELYILFYLAVLSATGLIPITTKKIDCISISNIQSIFHIFLIFQFLSKYCVCNRTSTQAVSCRFFTRFF